MWWERRLGRAFQMYDETRIDHFRGFAGQPFFEMRSLVIPTIQQHLAGRSLRGCADNLRTRARVPCCKEGVSGGDIGCKTAWGALVLLKGIRQYSGEQSYREIACCGQYLEAGGHDGALLLLENVTICIIGLCQEHLGQGGH